MADEPDKPSYGPKSLEEFQADIQRIKAGRQASRAKAPSESIPIAHPEPGTPEYSTGLRQAITEAAEQSERSSEKVAVSEQSASTTENGRYSLGDLVVLISCALFAEPFCHAAADAFLQEHYAKAALGFGVGMPAGLIGGTFHWWKGRLSQPVQRMAVPVAMVLGLIGLILVFFYVAGPDIYRRATMPIASAPISVPTTSLGPPPMSQRYYSAAEKEELANRISTTYQVLNSDMLELAEQWLGVYSHAFASKQDAEQFLKEIDALHVKTLTAHKKLWQDTVNGNPNFSIELRKLIAEDAAFPKLENAIGNFINGVSLYFLTYDYLPPLLRTQLAQLLRPFQGALFEASSELKKWVYQSNDRITERRKSL